MRVPATSGSAGSTRDVDEECRAGRAEFGCIMGDCRDISVGAHHHRATLREHEWDGRGRHLHHLTEVRPTEIDAVENRQVVHDERKARSEQFVAARTTGKFHYPIFSLGISLEQSQASIMP